MNVQRNPDMDDVVLAQVALNTTDMTATLRLYSELFGFDNGGGGVSWGDIARVQGLEPDAYWMRWWMVGGQPFFQLELFHHGHPKQRPLPENWRPCDHGWVRFGIAVNNFDRVVSGLQRRSIPVLGTAGAPGKRHLAFRDPHVGVILEIMEGAATSCPAVIYAASSVPDVARARYLYQGVLGAEIQPLELLHEPEDECPVVYGEVSGTYVVEPDFSVELVGIPAHLDKIYGFAPVGRFVAPYAPGEAKADAPLSG
jgi:catechol 2,3-dioxygenase-like lactoylglutathione lyase family enzyme